MLKDAMKSEILSSRALSYRKMTLGLAAVLVGLWWFNDRLDYSGLTLLGLKPTENTGGSRSLLIDSLWWLLGYHLAFFAYYSKRDVSDWWRVLSDLGEKPTKRPVFPEMRMYFGLQPVRPENRKAVRDRQVEPIDWKLRLENDKTMWVPRQEPAHGGSLPYIMATKLYRSVRERLLWFWGVDVGLPATLSLFALFTWR